MKLPDVQSELDNRGIELEAVGVSGLRYPVTFMDDDLRVSGIAEIQITAGLLAHARGVHMSRMVEVANEQLQEFDPRIIW